MCSTSEKRDYIALIKEDLTPRLNSSHYLLNKTKQRK